MSWQRVRGHDAQVRLFAEARRRGRLAHAYLFTGPAGVGKRLFAGELAKALLCENPPPNRLEACDRCPGCVQVEAGTHPDFFAIARPPDAPNMPIDAVRELCRDLALKPMRGHGKIAVVDDADDFDDPITGNAAANAFLKTLEEPPPGSVLILIGSSADRQLPTIRSRCQVVRFAPLPPALVAELLGAKGVADATLIQRLVRLSGGSPGQALALADPALWEFRRSLLKGLTQPKPDSVALARQWTAFAEEAGKEGTAQRRRAALALRLLIDLLDDALRISLGGDARVAEPDDLRPLQELAKRVDPERLLQFIDRCLEADVQIDRRVQLVLVLEALTDALGRG
jgi:DNA polymerase-3 subunit delta'